jgi:hypothetical protein
MQAILLGFPWLYLHLFGVAETPARDSLATYPTCLRKNSSVRVQASLALGAS